jgi:hypothetical protein
MLNHSDGQIVYSLIKMKKIKVSSSTKISELVEVSQEDGPDYPLLSFKGFDVRIPNQIIPTKANYPRKTEKSKGNVDVLIASTFGQRWATKSWPLSIFVCKNKEEELFDGRHTLKALNENKFPLAPVSLYERKKTGNDLLDGIKESSVLTLMGLYVNATDGTTNAVTHDFENVVKLVIEENNLPLTREVVNELLLITGVEERYSYPGTITTIKNAILDKKTKSTKVFNTTKEEQKDWIKSNLFFGNNNYSSVDGVAVRSKVLDSQFTYRYAGDILKWAFQSWTKNEKIRVLVYSNAEHENQIEQERTEILTVMEEIFIGPINFYSQKITSIFGGLITLPKVSISDLPLEIWSMPQIDGETEAIQLA